MTVFGKAGQADTPTDPAPLSMFETVVALKPPDQWRKGMTWDKLLAELNANIKTPGMANIFWMPIQTRTEMLATGFRSVLCVKVFGPDLGEIQKLAVQIEKELAGLPNTRSAFAERTVGGYFLDFTVNREAAARYGLKVGDVNDIVESAIGGKNITTTVEGRERYPVNARYARDFRRDIGALKRVLVATRTGAQVPIDLLADIRYKTGPPSVRSENGKLVGFVFVDVTTSDIDGYVRKASQQLSQRIQYPPGYYISWAGQFQYLEAAKERLKIVIPLTLLIIFVLLYMNTKSLVKTAIVLLAVPFSLIGAFWLLYVLGYNMSVAVWVGLIALAGLDAETGVVMLLYLDHAWEKFREAGCCSACPNDTADTGESTMSARTEERLETTDASRIRERCDDVRLALLLTYITIGWMTIEGAASLLLGWASKSLLLEAFGIDSVIELFSAAVLLWRLRIEAGGSATSERVILVEDRAARLVGYSLYALVAYVLLNSGYGLLIAKRITDTHESVWGILIGAVAKIGMPILAGYKLKVAAGLNSRALRADAGEVITGGYLSIVLILGVAATRLLGW